VDTLAHCRRHERVNRCHRGSNMRGATTYV
jgi:hypothetical protein